jgi:NAD(P)-dependent dehydrogenase (short-subunit alcohol dehydrogenase family)/acyl dehydratase/putative sterol carrier protein
MGLLENKVILITGAGNGIGRAHALACAREGARVVVNDLGGTRDGTGSDDSAASKVVKEIQELGAQAVANFDSVTDMDGCARMVKAAIVAWGKLDVVVNNAGILRDVTFKKMEDQQWDAVIAVHLQGTKNVIKAALPALSEKGGAIINTTSYSGLIGNFGQSNYAAAKGGVYGLTRVLALELKKSGITANCIAPIAKTRMTEELAMVDAAWTPEQISPVVVYLASDLAKNVTGRVFGIQGQRIHGYEMKMAEGVEKPLPELWTAQEIHEKLDDIFRLDAAPPAAAAAGDDVVSAVFAHFPAGFKKGKLASWTANLQWVVKGGTDQTILIENDTCTVKPGLHGAPTCTIKIDKDSLVAMFKGELDPTKAFMTGKATADNMGDLMKMATAFDFGLVGKSYMAGSGGTAPAAAGGGPPAVAPAPQKKDLTDKTWDGGYAFVEPKHLALYAQATNDESPAYVGDDAIAPPMFHVRLFRDLFFSIATDRELDLDMVRLVHGEHDATFHRPLRRWDLVHLRARLESIEEKSSGKLVTSRLFGFVDGQLAVECKTSYFVRAPKKEGSGEKKPEQAPPKPDWTRSFSIAPDQSLRYAEASKDVNPIHVDPKAAAAAGLPGLILHGLCTQAMSGANVLAQKGKSPRDLKRLSVRFSKPVLNGQTLTVWGWDKGNTTEFVVVGPDDKPVITGGVVELR